MTAKIPKSQGEFEEIQRRFKGAVEAARRTLQNAQRDFDKICNEYGDWARECRKQGYR